MDLLPFFFVGYTCINVIFKKITEYNQYFLFFTNNVENTNLFFFLYTKCFKIISRRNSVRYYFTMVVN